MTYQLRLTRPVVYAYMLQDVLVGGMVVGAIASTLYVGLQKEDVVCDLCQGNGGAKWVIGNHVNNFTCNPVAG